MAAVKRKPLLDPTEFTIEPLADNAEYRAAVEQLEPLHARSAETDERRRRALARRRSTPRPARNVVERARDLIQGGLIPGVDTDAELRACDEEDDILGRAITEQRQRIDDIAGHLSFEMAQRFREHHDAALIAAFDGMDATWTAFGTILALGARLRAAGYQPSSVALPGYIPQGALLLGDPAQFQTQSAAYRRWLVSQGILSK
jgi:hypothetical protein